jgi:GLPGLI family protein
MKLLTLFCLLISASTLAQPFGYIRYYAKYNILSPAMQVSKEDAEYETEDSWLFFTKKTSLFQQKLNYTATQVMKGPGGIEKKQISRGSPDKLDKTGTIYYKDLSNNELLYRENFTFSREKYNIAKDTLARINWIISNEKKSIGKFVCRRADANAFGRKWTAWFSTEIPVSVGPWKLWGLPGAILEAYDSTNNYLFLFREINIPNLEAEEKIKELKPAGPKFFSRAELIAEYRKRKDEKKKFIMSILEEGGGTGAVEFKEEIEPYK